MASRENDLLTERTLDGTVNLYDNGKSRGTAYEKGLASRMGGHTWNIITGSDAKEVYFCQVRNPAHPLFLGDSKTKVPTDPRGMMKTMMTAPAPHPRHTAMEQRRKEVQMAQTENNFSYRGFQLRCSELFPANPKKRYSIDNAKYCYEGEKMRPKHATKQDWAKRRGEQLTNSISCPSLEFADPSGSLDRAMRQDPWKRASQLQTESDHFAPRITACNVAMSNDISAEGREAAQQQRHLSVHRVENADYQVTKKNNHYSGADPTTRGDHFFRPPQNGRIANSVKYDIVSNQRKWFKY